MATPVAPDQGWESYLHQIQVHGVPPGAPTSAPSNDVGHSLPAAAIVTSGAGASASAVAAAAFPDASLLIAAVFSATGVPSVVTDLPETGRLPGGVSMVSASGGASDAQASLFSSGSQDVASIIAHLLRNAESEYWKRGDDFQIDLAGDYAWDWYFI